MHINQLRVRGEKIIRLYAARCVHRCKKLIYPMITFKITVYPLIIFMVSAVGCDRISTQRECEPGQLQGCNADQHCTLDDQLIPFCAPLSPDPLPLNAPCIQSQECGLNAGCVSVDGRARCMAFCSTERSLIDSQRECVERAGQGAACLYEVPDRPEIGLCTTPCRLDGATETSMNSECFEALSCALTYDLPFATCVTPGSAQLGEQCGVHNHCAAQLSCVLNGTISRCQQVWTSTPDAVAMRCDDDQVALAVREARDPISGQAYYACWSDIALYPDAHSADQGSVEDAAQDGMIRPQASLYRVDLQQSTLRDGIERCTRLSDPLSAAQLAELVGDESSLIAQLIADLRAQLTPEQLSPAGIWVAPLNYDLEAQTGDSLNGCQRLDLNTQRLEPTPCELRLPTLCELSYAPL